MRAAVRDQVDQGTPAPGSTDDLHAGNPTCGVIEPDGSDVNPQKAVMPQLVPNPLMGT